MQNIGNAVSALYHLLKGDRPRFSPMRGQTSSSNDRTPSVELRAYSSSLIPNNSGNSGYSADLSSRSRLNLSNISLDETPEELPSRDGRSELVGDTQPLINSDGRSFSLEESYDADDEGGAHSYSPIYRRVTDELDSSSDSTGPTFRLFRTPSSSIVGAGPIGGTRYSGSNLTDFGSPLFFNLGIPISPITPGSHSIIGSILRLSPTRSPLSFSLSPEETSNFSEAVDDGASSVVPLNLLDTFNRAANPSSVIQPSLVTDEYVQQSALDEHIHLQLPQPISERVSLDNGFSMIDLSIQSLLDRLSASSGSQLQTIGVQVDERTLFLAKIGNLSRSGFSVNLAGFFVQHDSGCERNVLSNRSLLALVENFSALRRREFANSPVFKALGNAGLQADVSEQASLFNYLHAESALAGQSLMHLLGSAMQSTTHHFFHREQLQLTAPASAFANGGGSMINLSRRTQVLVATPVSMLSRLSTSSRSSVLMLGDSSGVRTSSGSQWQTIGFRLNENTLFVAEIGHISRSGFSVNRAGFFVQRDSGCEWHALSVRSLQAPSRSYTCLRSSSFANSGSVDVLETDNHLPPDTLRQEKNIVGFNENRKVSVAAASLGLITKAAFASITMQGMRSFFLVSSALDLINVGRAMFAKKTKASNSAYRLADTLLFSVLNRVGLALFPQYSIPLTLTMALLPNLISPTKAIMNTATFAWNKVSSFTAKLFS